jgi:hypothetical protein
MPVQQLAIFLLECPSAMMLLLSLDVLQYAVQLARTDGNGCISALPEEIAITGFERFDPFRGGFLYSLNHLGLRKSARQSRDNVDVIGHTARAKGFAT